MALEDWMPTLETKIGEITGLDGGARAARQASNDDEGIPGALGEYPIAIILPTAGRLVWGGAGGLATGLAHEYTEVQITIYFAAGMLPEALNTAVDFIKLVRNKLVTDHDLDNKVVSILPNPEGWYEGPGGVEYAGKEYIGIIFRYIVKEDVSGEVTFPT